MITNMLILCVGNICRSPIGEALFKSRLQHVSPCVSVSSAGLSALVDYPADATGQELMTARGIDLSQHRARQLNAELAFKAELILTMDLDQQHHVEEKFPGIRGRVHRLGRWGGFDVPDPFQRPKVIFEQALLLIEQGVDEWYRTLWNGYAKENQCS